MKTMFKTTVAAAILMSSSAAMAAPSVAQKCEAAKNKVAGAYYACREKAKASALSKGLPTPDYTKCTAVFGDKWTAAQMAGEGMCPGAVTGTDADAFIASQATDTAAIIAGGAIPKCGDGVINTAGEHCDGAALDGLSCTSFGLHGSLTCTAGCDLDLSGCTSCPAPGISYGGACWFLGTLGANCDSTCAAASLVYDDRTRIIAGSEGSNANCVALLDLTGAPGGSVLDNAGGHCAAPVNGSGCAVLPDTGFRARCGDPTTTSSASWASEQRVCACQ